MSYTRHRHLPACLLAPCLVIGISLPALGDEAATSRDDDSVLDLTLGGVVAYEPDYEGSNGYDVSLFPYVELSAFDGLLSVSAEGAQAFLPLGELVFVGVGIGYDSGRDEDDSDDLEGLGDVDDTIVGSVSAGLLTDAATLSLAFTQDLDSGHEGHTIDLAAETGLEVIEDKAAITLGIGVTWASQNYTEAFFGVSAGQAAASGLDRFDADAGFKSAGVGLGIDYALTDHVHAGIEANYQRLLGDAADSPIVDDRGSPHQFSAGFFLGFEIGLL